MEEDKEEERLEDAAKADHRLDYLFPQIDRSFMDVIARSLLSMVRSNEQDELGGAKDDREGRGYDDSNHQSPATKVAEGDGALPRCDVARADCEHKEGVVESEIVTPVAHRAHQDEKSTGHLDKSPKYHGQYE